MELQELVGEHELSGVDFGTIPPNAKYDEAANTMSFVLDGHAYCVIEDPSDGYRSCMRDVVEVPIESVKNRFEPVRVLASHRTRGQGGDEDDVLEVRDVVTGKVVLEAGTRSVDDYYPSFVASFTPEHMACNAAATAPLPAGEARS